MITKTTTSVKGRRAKVGACVSLDSNHVEEFCEKIKICNIFIFEEKSDHQEITFHFWSCEEKFLELSFSLFFSAMTSNSTSMMAAILCTFV